MFLWALFFHYSNWSHAQLQQPASVSHHCKYKVVTNPRWSWRYPKGMVAQARGSQTSYTKVCHACPSMRNSFLLLSSLTHGVYLLQGLRKVIATSTQPRGYSCFFSLSGLKCMNTLSINLPGVAKHSSMKTYFFLILNKKQKYRYLLLYTEKIQKVLLS